MSSARLTDRFVESIAPPESGRIEVSDTHRLGLRLRVSANGKKVWVFEKRIKGGPKRKHTLGPYPTISLSDARSRAAELELEALRGIDRVEAEREERAAAAHRKLHARTVEEVLNAYSRLHLQNLRTADERERMLRRALTPFLDTPISQLSRRDLQGVVDAKADQGALVYANRHKAALSHFARFAWTRGYTETHIGDGLTGAIKEKPRDRVLTIEEMRAIWAATHDENGVFGPLVRLLMLTAQRRRDVAHLKWSEVNFDRQRIELAGVRTKNENAHITHLSMPSLAELKPLRDGAQSPDGYVFSTNGRTPPSGFSRLKNRLDARLGPNFEPWRFHDFRTAFATAMAEAGEPEGLVDRVLNHVASASAPSAVARVYNKSSQLPQRARLLDRWAEMVTGQTGTVVSLRADAAT